MYCQENQSSKMILYAIFFNSSGPVIQVPCPSGLTGAETGDEMMKPGCTCLSHKEGLIISNGSEKIKNTHVLPREPKFENDIVRNFL